ncbi:hypothetical protein ACNI3Q_01680 [Sphingomonas sp. FW199]|uniref:hypothetical protein n=1 Tax=Sphingomonas sp. FW199 TaxID=3400217 RepID=UPI003CE9C5FA
MSSPIDPLTARQMANAARRQMDVTAARLRDQLGPDEVLERLSSAAARKGQQFAAGLAGKAATSKPAMIGAALIGLLVLVKRLGRGTGARSVRLDEHELDSPEKDEQ